MGAAAEPSRIYLFRGRATKADCDLLPRSSFAIPPSLGRYTSADRLKIECDASKDGGYQLTMTFLLTDGSAPKIPKGQYRSYSFRWGAKVTDDKSPAYAFAGEFTRDEAKCERILKLFRDHATTPVDSSNVSWSGGCYGEDHWGMAMEITLLEKPLQ